MRFHEMALDAQDEMTQTLEELESQLGFPSELLRTLASDSPDAFKAFATHIRADYLDSPIPALLCERILARLSRYCRVSYPTYFHSLRLRKLGLSRQSIFSLLGERDPSDLPQLEDGADDLDRWIQLGSWPEAGTLGERYLVTLTEFYFQKGENGLWAQRRLLKSLGRESFNALSALIVFARAFHDWAESYPEISWKEPFLEGNCARLDDVALESNRSLRRENTKDSPPPPSESILLEDRFLLAAVQEMRDSVRMVTAFLQLIERKCRNFKNRDIEECIEFALGGARKLRAVVAGLGDYGNLALLEEPVRTVDLNHVVVEVCECLKGEIERTEASVLPEALPEIKARPHGLREILERLIRNSVSFCDERKPQVVISCVEESERWIVRVRDNGNGIPEWRKANLFLPFQHTRGQGDEGKLGIGLAIAKQLVQRQGGALWVESTAGVGSTFFFSVPKPEGHTGSVGGSR